MTKELAGVPQEVLTRKFVTRLSMIVDPANQDPQEAANRTETFIESGGSAIFVGGSGEIDSKVFVNTVKAISSRTNKRVPLFILPGSIGQGIASTKLKKDISGIFTYTDIIGTGRSFDKVYPPIVRDLVDRALMRLRIRNIPTVYVLCGDPNASVSKVSGILPLNLEQEENRASLMNRLTSLLKSPSSIECVFFEAGSGSANHASYETVREVGQMIRELAPKTMLVVSGGIRTPEQAKMFAGIADYVNVGTHFEQNGAVDTREFVGALK
jgi:heptaprenylglyceryl phosphate synthase